MGQQRQCRIPYLGKTRLFDPGQMAGKNFRGADLRGFDLHELDMHDACFEWADLTGANLRGANLKGANLRAAHLNEADLTGANLQRTELWQAWFSDARTRHTDFRRARNLACRTGTAYNAHIYREQLRRAICDMNYPVWQCIWRLQRACLWSLVGVALAVGARFARWLVAPWSHGAIIAAVSVLLLCLLGLARAHYIRLYKTTYRQN